MMPRLPSLLLQSAWLLAYSYLKYLAHDPPCRS
jgi:hypothetical protein